jgi:tRNA (cytidine/uridine-2'-O-)-methyltransferase
MLNVVLYQPEIPSNTGNIGRTCVVTGARLHLIHPLGFKLDDQALKRAGMNYWHNLDVREHAGWEEFLANEGLAQAPERLHLLTKRASRVYTQATYHDGDYLVFGKESTGIAQDILAGLPQCCERIPMLADAQALDDGPAWHAHHEELAGADAPASQTRPDICGNFVRTGFAGISSLNLSNSVAIVVYEALRQTGYPSLL